jgi:hypothetical protein
MASSDIYEVKESPAAKKTQTPSRQGRRRRHSKTYDEAVNPDISHTHRRRSHNSGFRRFQHQMRKPEFSKKFWGTILSVSGLILITLIVWDLFFRYPKQQSDRTPGIYRAVVE